jgi:hypothetical protein
LNPGNFEEQNKHNMKASILLAAMLGTLVTGSPKAVVLLSLFQVFDAARWRQHRSVLRYYRHMTSKSSNASHAIS